MPHLFSLTHDLSWVSFLSSLSPSQTFIPIVPPPAAFAELVAVGHLREKHCRRPSISSLSAQRIPKHDSMAIGSHIESIKGQARLSSPVANLASMVMNMKNPVDGMIKPRSNRFFVLNLEEEVDSKLEDEHIGKEQRFSPLQVDVLVVGSRKDTARSSYEYVPIVFDALPHSEGALIFLELTGISQQQDAENENMDGVALDLSQTDCPGYDEIPLVLTDQISCKSGKAQLLVNVLPQLGVLDPKVVVKDGSAEEDPARRPGKG